VAMVCHPGQNRQRKVDDAAFWRTWATSVSCPSASQEQWSDRIKELEVPCSLVTCFAG